MAEPRRSSRRHKIEPLNYAEAALAPALKGMTSFLDVRAEDVRNGTLQRVGLELAAIIDAPSDNHLPSKFVSSPADVLTPGDETDIEGEASTPTRSPSSNGHLGAVTSISSKKETALEEIREYESFPDELSSPRSYSPPGDETYTGGERSAPASAPDEGLTPGRGRSKIRKCVLAQDGHSLGEEAIYQVLWRAGRPENGDPNGSRTIRIGAAELGYKINMAKKNVRQNISRLFEKLALEIVEDFETMNSQARLYRIYSYKQILERRRAVGMEYVLRNKGVVFCSRDGSGIVASPAYVSPPGGQSSIRPAPPKKRRPTAALPQAQQSQITMPPSAGESEKSDLEQVSQALNRYWSVDQAAAVQLLRDCRRVRPDARAKEIAFFVGEKLELARGNRSITNPTGLILATVPQSFAGSTFEEFRLRQQRQAALAAEEAERRQRTQADLKVWLLDEREKCEATLNDLSKSEQERDAAEKRLRNLATWNP